MRGKGGGVHPIHRVLQTGPLSAVRPEKHAGISRTHTPLGRNRKRIAFPRPQRHSSAGPFPQA